MVDFLDEDIEWTEEKYSLSIFKDKTFQLPAVVKITTGFYGRTDYEEFSSDEILILYEWNTEERVMARNKRRLTISIPIDFEHKLHVKQQGQASKVLPLSKIVQDFLPPVTASFDPKTDETFYVNEENFSTDSFGTMTLMSSHYLEYVTASTTVQGKVSLEHLVCLPVYRKVRFVIAKKVRGFSVEDMKQHLDSYLSMILTIRKKQDVSSSEYQGFTEHKLGIVDYTEMLDTIEDYAYLRFIPRGPWGLHRNKQPPLISPNQQLGPIHNLRNRLQGFATVLRQRPSKITETMKSKEAEKQKEKPSSPTTLPSKQALPQEPPNPDALNGKPPMTTYERLNYKVEIPRIVVTGDAPRPPGPSRTNGNPPKRPQLPLTLSTENLHRRGSMHDYDTLETSSSETKPPLPERDIPAPVAPTRTFLSLQDVPGDRSTLTVEEMCRCLQLLKLEKFIPKFRHAQMNGQLLQNCSAEVLGRDFDMSVIQAKKLKMFADEGWCPKT